MLEYLEQIFQSLRDGGPATRFLITLATTLGLLSFIWYLLRLIFDLIQGARLYICSQYCCKTDYKQRYGTWAVITGATDGVGRSMAKELAARGHSLIIVARNDERLSRVKRELESIDNVGEVITVKIDFSDSNLSNYSKLFRVIDAENRDVGILINNVGTIANKFLKYHHSDLNFLRTLVNVNVHPTLYLTRNVLPGMIKRKRGIIVNVTALTSGLSVPYMSAYNPTKTLICELTRQLRYEYSNEPIDFIDVRPGAFLSTHVELMEPGYKPSCLVPSPDRLAKSVINALATRVSFFSGTMAHGLQRKAVQLVDTFGMIPFFAKHLFEGRFGDENSDGPVISVHEKICSRKNPPGKLESVIIDLIASKK